MNDLKRLAAEEGELRLLSPLVRLLVRTRRLQPGAYVRDELPWHGRRVDLATLGRSGVLSAYELKLSNFGRLLEQGLYNELSFDRSWLVTGSMPSSANLQLVRRHAVGLIVVSDDVARVVVAAPLRANDPILRRRLTIKLRAIGRCDV